MVEMTSNIVLGMFCISELPGVVFPVGSRKRNAKPTDKRNQK